MTTTTMATTAGDDGDIVNDFTAVALRANPSNERSSPVVLGPGEGVARMASCSKITRSLVILESACYR